MNTLEASKNSHDIILKPVIIEKSSTFMDEGKYTLEADPRASKIEIKTTIGATLGVKVSRVATQGRKDKAYRVRTGRGKRKDVKRVIVILREGVIDVFSDQVWARRGRGQE